MYPCILLYYYVSQIMPDSYDIMHFSMIISKQNLQRNISLNPVTPQISLTPKSKILHLLCDFDEIWNKTYVYVYQ